jgi:hypothetical protein
VLHFISTTKHPDTKQIILSWNKINYTHTVTDSILMATQYWLLYAWSVTLVIQLVYCVTMFNNLKSDTWFLLSDLYLLFTPNCVKIRNLNIYLPMLCYISYPLLNMKISRKTLVRVYNAHELLKKIMVGNVRIKCQSYIFLIVLSVFLLLRTIIFFKLD